jgi:hypothetical protein
MTGLPLASRLEMIGDARVLRHEVAVVNLLADVEVISPRRRVVRRAKYARSRKQVIVVEVLPAEEQDHVIGPRLAQRFLHVLRHREREIHAPDLGGERTAAGQDMERGERVCEARR